MQNFSPQSESSRGEKLRNEFSHRVALAEISQRGLTLSLEANPQERDQVAKRLGLVAVAQLAGKFALTREAGGVVRATGHLQARCTQTCVVSLEPLTRELRKPLRLRFFPRLGTQAGGVHRQDRETPKAGKKTSKDGFVLIEDPFAQDEEDALFYDSQGLDLGEALVQELALSLDPYPRRENASLAQTRWGDEPADPTENPTEDPKEDPAEDSKPPI